MVKEISKRISKEQRLKIKYKVRHLIALLYPFNLNKIALIHKTDKYGNHSYTPHYINHFRKFKLHKIRLLEIGVGGYDDPYIGGNSLRMWKSYFPFAKIFSLDIYDKSFLEERRIKIFQGSQIDELFLHKVLSSTGNLDIIIDDGSHVNEHVIKSFKYLFPKLKKGGIYVVEDTQTSYWEDYGGSSDHLDKPGTIYNFFKSLINGLNHEEFIIDGYESSYYDKNITSIHFYHNMIFICKGDNLEKSNFVVNNKVPR